MGIIHFFEANNHFGQGYEGYVEGEGYQFPMAGFFTSGYFQESGFCLPQFSNALINTPEAKSNSVNNCHKVQPGETLFSISRKYGLTLEALKDANPILKTESRKNGDLIFSGEELKLPASECILPRNSKLQQKGEDVSRNGSAQSGGLLSIDGVTAPWNNEAIVEKYHQVMKYLDGTNQIVGYGVSLTGLAVEDIKFFETTGKFTFFAGLGISALRTDWSSTQSVTEFGIGGGLSTWAYFCPWAIPFAGAYSVTTIDKEYSKTLPQRAAEGYKSSNQQIRSHPYFKNLDW